MSSRLLLLMIVSACAGPSIHRTSALATAAPEAVRAPVATTLASADPLAVSNCALPTAPSAACQDLPALEKKPEPHQHHPQAEAPAPTSEASRPVEPMEKPQTKAAPTPARAPADTKVTDPVCKMKIDPKTAGGGTLTHQGKQHWFCSSSCRRTFLTQYPGAK